MRSRRLPNKMADKRKTVSVTCPRCSKTLQVNIIPGIFNLPAMSLQSMALHVLQVTGGVILIYGALYLEFDVRPEKYIKIDFLRWLVELLLVIVGLCGGNLLYNQFIDRYNVLDENYDNEKAHIEHDIEK